MPAPAKSAPKTKNSRASPDPDNGRVRAPLKKGDHVFLVDGSGYIFRAYHAIGSSRARRTARMSMRSTASATCCGSCSRR